MTSLDISTETIRYWLDEMERHFRPAIIHRGYEYTAQGMVLSVHADNGTLLAYVQGSGRNVYTVRLDAGYFGLSHCSCPYEGYCKHMSAVIFKVCTLVGLNLHSIAAEVLFSRDLQGFAKREVAAGREKSLKQILKEHDRTHSARSPLTESSPAGDWKKWLDGLLDRNQSGAELAHLRLHLTDEADRLTKQWPDQAALLFKLVVELALLNAADQLARKFDVLYNVSYNGPSIAQLVQAGMHQIETLADRLDAEGLRRTHPQHVLLLREELGNHPFDMSVSNIDWLAVYRLLWWKVLNEPRWMREEEARIRDMLRDGRMIARKRELLRCALVHFQLMRGEDGQAMSVIESLDLYRTPDWWQFYLERFRREHAWERLMRWLRWMLPQMKTASGRERMKQYLDLWKQAAKHTDCEGEWKEALQRLLPFSYIEYEEFLFERKSYLAWADIMMSLGIHASQISRERLSQAEAEEPRAVLPLLHQAVEYHISRKNREDYRFAVKCLKQLEAVYRRLDRTDLWQEYMRQLNLRYHRLRSFQDELKKGGLRA